jgi:hypothetical protein
MIVPPAPKEMLYAAPATVAEHRLRVQQAEQERAALRATELAEQVAPAREADERIRIWERLHALRLPRSSGHALVTVIATQTCLTIGQVHEEQRRRAAMVARRGPSLLPDGGAVVPNGPSDAARAGIHP